MLRTCSTSFSDASLHPASSMTRSSLSLTSSIQLDAVCNAEVRRRSKRLRRSTTVVASAVGPQLPARASCSYPQGRPRHPMQSAPSRQCRTQAFNEPASASGPAYQHNKEVDPFVAASHRLQSLLAGVGDGETELVDMAVSEESPESRLSMQAALGGVVSMVAVAVSMLAGQDPWGGASLSLDSLTAAGLGATAALPFVVLRHWSWSPAAAKVLPQLEDMHLSQLSLQSPWYSRCAPWHVMAMMAMEVLPMTLLLLPATQGGLLAAVNMYTSVLQGLGAPGDAPSELLQLACLAVTASVAGIGKGLELGVTDSEFEVVQTAVQNADRYYRLMAKDVHSRPGNAAHAALAFRSVAQAWLGTRNDASLASVVVCALDIMFLGGLWYATGDLTAPAVAALAINAVDYHHTYQAVLKREARLATANSNGSGDKSGPNPGTPGA